MAFLLTLAVHVIALIISNDYKRTCFSYRQRDTYVHVRSSLSLHYDKQVPILYIVIRGVTDDTTRRMGVDEQHDHDPHEVHYLELRKEGVHVHAQGVVDPKVSTEVEVLPRP